MFHSIAFIMNAEFSFVYIIYFSALWFDCHTFDNFVIIILTTLLLYYNRCWHPSYCNFYLTSFILCIAKWYGYTPCPEKGSTFFDYNSGISWLISIIFCHHCKQEWILHYYVYFTYLIAWWHHNCDMSQVRTVYL